jgi:hypothetical protein
LCLLCVQLGQGTTASRELPPSDDVLTGVVAVPAGQRFTCAVMIYGGLRCWGMNYYGQVRLC